MQSSKHLLPVSYMPARPSNILIPKTASLRGRMYSGPWLSLLKLCPWASTRPQRRIKLVNRWRRAPEVYLPLLSLFAWALGRGQDMQRDLIGPPQIRHRIEKSVDPGKVPLQQRVRRGDPIVSVCAPFAHPCPAPFSAPLRLLGVPVCLLRTSTVLPPFRRCFAPRGTVPGGTVPASHGLSGFHPNRADRCTSNPQKAALCGGRGGEDRLDRERRRAPRKTSDRSRPPMLTKYIPPHAS